MEYLYTKQQQNVRNNREYDSLTKEIEFQTLDIQLSEKRIKEYKVIVKEKEEPNKETKTIIKEKWFAQDAISTEKLSTIISTIITQNPSIVEQYKWGKTATLWFFVGQTMKATQWKSNPQTIQKILTELLK